MIDKDDIYKELTIIMENTYMTNGDDVLTMKRTVNADWQNIYKQMKIIPNTDENKTDSLG